MHGGRQLAWECSGEWLLWKAGIILVRGWGWSKTIRTGAMWMTPLVPWLTPSLLMALIAKHCVNPAISHAAAVLHFALSVTYYLSDNDVFLVILQAKE